MLEKILESPLDCKEIKPVNPKGNQPWIFIGRTDAEAPILWPPDMKSWLFGKYPDVGKDWGQKEKGVSEDEMVRQHQQLNGHESEQTLGDGEGQGSQVCCSPGGSQRAGHDLATEWHTVLYDAVLVSAAQQSESAIHIHIAPLFSSHLDHHRALGRVPCAIGNTRLSLVINFIHSINTVCMSIPISQFIPSPPWGTF